RDVRLRPLRGTSPHPLFERSSSFRVDPSPSRRLFVKVFTRSRVTVALAGAVALGTAAYLVVTPANACNTASRSSERKLVEAAEGNFEVLEQADQYAEARTAPADLVDAGAFSAGDGAYKALPVVPGTWTELTKVPYDSDAHGYRDPVWSNSGGGAQHVAGRMTALALDGSTLYA